MRDRFLFSDAQDLTGVDSTGVISANIWDLEEDVTVDQQLVGWVNFLFGASNAGATEGLYLEVRADNDTNLASPTHILGMLWLSDVTLTAAIGKIFSVGIAMAELEKYVGIWYRAYNTALAGTATPVDAYFTQFPDGMTVTQKKPS